MCGIIGYLGYPEKTLGVLIEGLRRLEYRGYDSSGVAVQNGQSHKVVKSVGKIDNLAAALATNDGVRGPLGMGHTRWATHGPSTLENAHPQQSGSTCVVHNGIIENFLALRRELAAEGYEFVSDTDTEVVAHLVERFLEDGLAFEKAVLEAVGRLEGTYALLITTTREPGKLVAVRRFSPLVVAVGDGEYYLASDPAALLPYSRSLLFLDDGEMAVVTAEGVTLYDLEGKVVVKEPVHVTWDPVQTEKAGFKHFMLKEIYQQPQAVMDTIRGRFDPDRVAVVLEGLEELDFGSVHTLHAVACGTSYHASLVGKYMIERLTGLPLHVEFASEFRYSHPALGPDTLVIAVSQSGETADTLEAIAEARRHGAPTLGITNVAESQLARTAEATILTRAGREIGVASTKAFTSQLAVFYLLAVHLGLETGRIGVNEASELVGHLMRLPKLLELTLKMDDRVAELARGYHHCSGFLYLGRGINYPIALEGALKLKEISYIHAEAHAAGEMKHGPIALVDENLPVVVLSTGDHITHAKTLGNVEEIIARGGRVILVTDDDVPPETRERVEYVIEVPRSSPLTCPFIAVVPLQLLAYHIAAHKGTDIDQPRNLAKVVTVE